jgi:hypothetical protein
VSPPSKVSPAAVWTRCQIASATLATFFDQESPRKGDGSPSVLKRSGILPLAKPVDDTNISSYSSPIRLSCGRNSIFAFFFLRPPIFSCLKRLPWILDYFFSSSRLVGRSSCVCIAMSPLKMFRSDCDRVICRTELTFTLDLFNILGDRDSKETVDPFDLFDRGDQRSPNPHLPDSQYWRRRRSARPKDERKLHETLRQRRLHCLLP